MSVYRTIGPLVPFSKSMIPEGCIENFALYSKQVVIQLANLSNFICPHQSYCHPNCYERQRRSCSRLITSVKKIYESVEEEPVKETDKKLEEKRDMLKERLKRRVGSDCYTEFQVKWLFAFEP